jgi:hypothetical protein
MNKVLAVSITILLVVGLSACGTSTTTMNPSKSSGNNLKTLSTVEELVLGTLKLEGTSQEAVDKTQAATFLPLWKAYIELQSNNSTASEEVDAVISQIQSSMTTDQTKAIDNLKLTSQDLLDTMASFGITITLVTPQGTPSASIGQDIGVGVQVDAGGGSPPARGVPPSGGGGPQNGTGGPGGSTSGTSNLSQSQIATMQASAGTVQGANGTTGLIEKLITVLEQMVQS